MLIKNKIGNLFPSKSKKRTQICYLKLINSKL